MELNRVHRQRIGVAVRAALGGVEVRIKVDWHFNAFANGLVVWTSSAGKKKNVIANGSKHAMEALLPAVQAEFVRQLAEASQPEAVSG